jgi:hypothetical protein
MSFKKMFYWLIKIGAPLTVILIPAVALYGTMIGWMPASPTLAKFQPETPIMIGFSESHKQSWIDGTWYDNSYSQRQYILFPSVFRHPKIISIRQNAGKTLIVTESEYGFIYAVVWYLLCLIATWFFWFRPRKEDMNESTL